MGGRFGEDDGERRGEDVRRVAAHEFEGEDIEEVGIDEDHVGDEDRCLAVAHQDVVEPRQYADGLFDLGIVGHQRRRHRTRGDDVKLRLPRLGRHDLIETIEALGVRVETVDAQFRLHVEQNQQATRDADGQPGDVDERVAWMLAQMAQGDFEVVF